MLGSTEFAVAVEAACAVARLFLGESVVGVRVLGRIEGEPILDEAFGDLPEDEVIGAEVVGQMATEVDAELPAQISVETPIEKL